MEKVKIIELLNLDLQDEHGAIIQYLTHAYAMGEGAIACEVEAVSRDEMRHLDWLAETIVELGGKPSIKRGTMRMEGKAPPAWMGDNVFLEEGAIKQYTGHIRLIDDPKIKRLLSRILADEKAHREKFVHFIDKTKEAGVKDKRGVRRDGLAKTINWGIGNEYTAILQYMFHSYLSKKAEAKKQLEDQAINEMQHLGWLSEEMVDGGGTPKIEYGKPDLAIKPADMLKADIKIEKEAAEVYDRAAKDTKDAGLKDLFLRIRDNEKYHIEIFNDLLKEEKE
jgi:bacterioferritin